MMEIALESGAEDVKVDGDVATLIADPEEFVSVKTALEANELTFLSAELAYVPQNTVAITEKEDAKKVLRLIDELEDNDDVQSVHSNFEIPDEWIEELSA